MEFTFDLRGWQKAMKVENETNDEKLMIINRLFFQMRYCSLNGASRPQEKRQRLQRVFGEEQLFLTTSKHFQTPIVRRHGKNSFWRIILNIYVSISKKWEEPDLETHSPQGIEHFRENNLAEAPKI